MKRIEKYAHLDIELPQLPDVLLNTIQSDILQIRGVDKSCDKFQALSMDYPALKDAVFVVYSSYVKKSDHKYEKFIFLGEKGNELCDLGGHDFELYGLLQCVAIPFTEEYSQQEQSC